MSRKTVIIIVIGVLVVLALLLLYVLFGMRTADVATGPEPDPFDPFGNGGQTVSRNPNARTPGTIFDPNSGDLNPLWRVTNIPVAASTVYTTSRNNEDFKYVRYIERGSGHIFEAEVSVREPIKLSNTTIPRIQESMWFPTDPNKLLIRYLDSTNANIQTFMAKITDESDTDLELTDEDRINSKKIEGMFLIENITEITPSPYDTSVFYFVTNSNGSRGIVRSKSGESKTVYSSPMRELRPQWVSRDLVTVTSKASQEAPGFLYFLNPETQKTRLILSGLTALITNTSYDENTVLHYTKENQISTLRTYDVQENSTTNILSMTLPEKCVWSRTEQEIVYCAIPSEPPQRDYPDGWYQGKSRFNDYIARINTKTQDIILLALHEDFVDLGAPFGVDAHQLVLSQEEDYLTFINKKDLSLWAYSLERFAEEREDQPNTEEEEE